MAYYAWTKLKKEINEWGRVDSWIEPGDTISASDLNLSDAQFNELVASGAVREEKYPDIPAGMTAAQYFRSNPDEAPSLDVDATTPSDEAMGKIETADEAGKQLPTGDEEQSKKPWEK